jgi:MipA family protein
MMLITTAKPLARPVHAIFGGLFFCAVSGFVLADEEPVMLEKPLWELGFGAGLLVQPHYPSSSETQVRGLGLPYIVYRGDVLRIGDGQSARAVAAESNLYELSMSFDAAFDADSEGNTLRQGMSDLDFVFEIGPQLMFLLGDYTFSDTSRSELQFSLQARAAFSTDFGRVNHRGYVFEPMLRYRHYGLFRPDFEATVSIRPVWATRDLHAYFFDVESAFATATRPEYKASRGYYGTGVNFYGTWHINKKARLFLGLQTSWLQGAQSSGSPLFERKFTTGFGAGLIWSFIESKRTVLRP